MPCFIKVLHSYFHGRSAAVKIWTLIIQCVSEHVFDNLEMTWKDKFTQSKISVDLVTSRKIWKSWKDSPIRKKQSSFFIQRN